MINTFMYICKHFIIQELVSPQTYEDRGRKAWELLDTQLLITLDRLRETYGKMTINNWRWGGHRKWSGLRTPESEYYSTYSMHSHGKAFDILFEDITAAAVRFDILNTPDAPEFEFINAMESDVSWLHIDIRNCERVKVFKP